MSTVEQPTLPGLAEGERLRDEGMARVTEASDEDQVEQLDMWIGRVNSEGIEWSANLIRAMFPECKPQLIGARVRAAAARKEMVRVGYEPSTLPSTHAHPIAVWRGNERTRP